MRASLSASIVSATVIAVSRSSFELALPLHAPPTATLGAAGLAVHLAYELRITFEARVPGEAAAASAGVAEAEADPPTSKLPWRLPVLRLLPLGDRPHILIHLLNTLKASCFCSSFL